MSSSSTRRLPSKAEMRRRFALAAAEAAQPKVLSPDFAEHINAYGSPAISQEHMLFIRPFIRDVVATSELSGLASVRKNVTHLAHFARFALSRGIRLSPVALMTTTFIDEYVRVGMAGASQHLRAERRRRLLWLARGSIRADQSDQADADRARRGQAVLHPGRVIRPRTTRSNRSRTPFDPTAPSLVIKGKQSKRIWKECEEVGYDDLYNAMADIGPRELRPGQRPESGASRARDPPADDRGRGGRAHQDHHYPGDHIDVRYRRHGQWTWELDRPRNAMEPRGA